MTRRVHPLAPRMAAIQPFHVMALLARAQELDAQGRDVVHMEIGEPDFVTPGTIIEAGRHALAEGKTHYTPAAGLPALREAIAAHYVSQYNVKISPERIVVTPGASGALMLLVAAIVGVGDEVLMPDPGYPCNRNFVRVVDGVPVGLPVGPEQSFQPSLEQVEQRWTDQSVALLLASPANPTGMMIPQQDLARLHKFVTAKRGCLIVDEIYHGLTYGREAQTALSIADDLFVINSFSKYFGMTGWRLGWLVAPQAYVPELEKLAQNLFLAASTVAQYAALEAFTPATRAILEERRTLFQQRRDYLLPALQGLGFRIDSVPEGAFYLYADCSEFTDDSFSLARNLLEQAGVAVTPGLDFGEHKPEQFLRFAYTTSLARLEEGIDRLSAYLRS